MQDQIPHFIPEYTPAFVYDESRIARQLALLAEVRRRSGARLLYSVKALPWEAILDAVLPGVDGFSASSLFEARWAAEFAHSAPRRVGLHITTPGFRAGDIDGIAAVCDYLSFNSLEQCRRFLPGLPARVSPGIRVNPGLSFLDDPRYDPCRPYSKLGVPLAELAAALAGEPGIATRIEGLHFHTLFESASFAPLRETLARLEQGLGPRLDGLRWINLGGGYLLETGQDVRDLAGVVLDFKRRHDLDVFFEPGKAVVGRAGSLATRVIDRFERGGKAVAVLDTGVHHLPEVFEYQKAPALREHRPDGGHACLLVGCTCLAGDVFGEYRFDRPLQVGDALLFENVGAYALVKASRFNGYDLPALYLRGADGSPRLAKRYGYEDYRRLWAAAEAAPLDGSGPDI
ncbi:carboxynorspermidine decarboxylase [Methylomagnum ishizawai]|uniref:carboxynorspermidine decarboxylase n=1 Tax=Methylomagnum ishizawai TaxID=1760988 RepID=UPI001C320B57|nr:carboxynorspermidine decarboxylase [Methylomagnum ishizawai]BBL75872.1 hypothetical protein MishRS11D_29700 [Methylomagnum ishizawai]